MNLLDPNIGTDVLSDEELMQEYHHPNRYKRMNLYAVMASRAHDHEAMKQALFHEILNEEALDEHIAGDIKRSWIPAILLLKHAQDPVKLELRSILRTWPEGEKVRFLEYIRSEAEYFCLLYDIL